jgi:hypothetical protein
MGLSGFLAALAVLALLFGCVQGERERQADLEAHQPAFRVPKSQVEYTAHYTVLDSGEESSKAVYRSGDRARVDLRLGSSEVRLYFLADRAYSCSNTGSGFACFDISAKVGSSPAALELLDAPSLSGAKQLEDVDIGGTVGRCYLLPYAQLGSRKLCLTDRGVVAYDEYSSATGQKHTEYLTDIFYGVAQGDFDLPASPIGAHAG